MTGPTPKNPLDPRRASTQTPSSSESSKLGVGFTRVTTSTDAAFTGESSGQGSRNRQERAISLISAGIFIQPDGLPDWPFWKGRRLASERSLVIVFLVGISKPK